MAGFCRNCGSPLADGQGFCTKCGTRVGEASPPTTQAAQPAAQPPAQPAHPAAAPPPPTAAPSYASGVVPPPAPKGSPLIKILLVVAGLFVFFGIACMAALFYIGHRVHQRVQEMGLTADSHHVSTLGGVNTCSLLSKDDVSRAIGLEVVRAEPDHGDRLTCKYSVLGDAGDLTVKHAIRLSQEIAKNTGSNQPQMSKSQQDDAENIGKTLFHSMATDPNSGLADHPGETPVFSVYINDNAAQFQMKVDRVAFSRIGPAGTGDLPNLGDEAFDAAGAMMLVRKGDKMIRVMYMQCPCVKDDVVPLVRTVLAGLP
jgi:hypothetical protein